MTQEGKKFEHEVSINPVEAIQQASQSVDVLKLYANGFICARSNSDVMVVLQLNGQPSSIVNLSFTTAKSLAMNLKATVELIEGTMEQKIMTIEDIDKKTRSKS